MSNNPFLYPNVTSLPIHSEVASNGQSIKKQGVSSEFDQVFEQTIQDSQEPQEAQNLQYIKPPLKFSAHAAQRLKDRKITLDPMTLLKVHDAIDQAAAKGVEDSLILTPEAAFVVSVKNRTVITALDRRSIAGNVFTHIDGAVIL